MSAHSVLHQLILEILAAPRNSLQYRSTSEVNIELGENYLYGFKAPLTRRNRPAALRAALARRPRATGRLRQTYA